MDIAERLAKVLKEKKLTANELSKIIAVQRSTLSHILSGRNKPSLDLIERFYLAYPEISLEWLISGKGTMFHPINGAEATVAIVKPIEVENELFKGAVIKDSEAKQTEHSKSLEATLTASMVSDDPDPIYTKQAPVSKQAIKTIIFYDNGTFDVFVNSLL